MIDKSTFPTKLLWVDLEMTGLQPNKDVILEIAAVITDFEFKTLTTFEAIVKHPQSQVRQLMDDNKWWEEYPDNRQEFINKTIHGEDQKIVQQKLIALIDQYFGSDPVILAGNSIHSDRKFIAYHWPEVDRKLYYRMLDVSSWKIVMQGLYQQEFEKTNAHRALDDIKASIAELQFYLNWLKTANFAK